MALCTLRLARAEHPQSHHTTRIPYCGDMSYHMPRSANPPLSRAPCLPPTAFCTSTLRPNMRTETVKLLATGRTQCARKPRGSFHAKTYRCSKHGLLPADHGDFSRNSYRTWNTEQDHAVGLDRRQATSGSTRATTDESLAHRARRLTSSTIIGRLMKTNDPHIPGDFRQVLRCPAHITSPFNVGGNTTGSPVLCLMRKRYSPGFRLSRSVVIYIPAKKLTWRLSASTKYCNVGPFRNDDSPYASQAHGRPASIKASQNRARPNSSESSVARRQLSSTIARRTRT